MTVTLDTPHARDMLRKRFAAPEWAYLEEVAPATGGGTRYADAVAVNLWQSRGHAVYGFEIKVSRGDWLRELKKPEKAEQSVFSYCDRWFIVAPAGVLKDGELPPTWGYMELREGGLVARVEAPKLEPKPIGRAFFASLMRRGFESIDKVAESKQRLAVMQAHKEIDERVAAEVKRKTQRFDSLVARLNKLKEQSGLDFLSEYAYPPPDRVLRLAQQLHALDGFDPASPMHHLEDLARQLEVAAKTVREARAAALRTPASEATV